MKIKASSIYIAAVVVTAAFLCAPNPAWAQQPPLTAQLPQGFQSDPYVTELLQLVNLWNSKDLRLPARDAVMKGLDARVQSVIRSPTYAYQTNTWAQAMLTQAAALPNILVPRATIDDPAALVLVSLFIKDLGQYKKQVPQNAVREQLQTPLFLILARAQQMAGQGQINAAIMIRSIFSWWTTVWPFCDK